jgi:DNA-binding NtrC family response regulator
MSAHKEPINLKKKLRYETTILPLKEQHGQFMRAYLEFVITSLDGNISAASRVLEMNRAHLYNLMERYGIVRIKTKKNKLQEGNG